MPSVVAALPIIGGALFSTPQSLADAVAGVPCSDAAIIVDRKSWTQSEFCTWKIPSGGKSPENVYIHGVSKNEKVGNQNVLYLPTSPSLCLCITWGNRKLENCIFFA